MVEIYLISEERMNLDTLIKEITPLYNSYKENTKTIKGTDAVKIMWEIGDWIKRYLEKNNTAPHTLYRQIYGKSEGTTNTEQRSYLTREFLGRSYRIRNMFSSIKEIEGKFPNLQRFLTFREAMPFFDNPKYKFSGKEMDALVNILNSNNSQKAFQQVRQLQKIHIGIKNPRNQRLEELEKDKNVFIDFYNYIYELSKKTESEQRELLSSLGISRELLNLVSQETIALTEDGLQFSDLSLEPLSKIPAWGDYVQLIDKYKSQSNPKLVRRFRRLIPPIRMINLGEMLHKLNT